METNGYFDLPEKRESETNNVYEYDSSATPKRITYLYEVTYVNNSKDNSEP